jgi:hypothetical protein
VLPIAAMGTLLAGWLVAVAACLGIGLLGFRLAGVREVDVDRGFQAFWIGFALVLWLLQIWHLLLPVSPVAGAVLLCLGCTGLWLGARLRFEQRLRSSWPFVIAAVLLALWFSNLSLRGLQHYDTGLYLLGSVHWASEHRAVPGLGNLHGRFAFNNAHLLYAALFRVGPWAERVPNLVNGSLLCVFLMQSAWCGRRLLAESRAGHAFGLLMALPALVLANLYLVSLSTDLPATLLAMLVAWRTFRLLVGESAGREREELIGITLLAAAAVSVKLSSAVFVGVCWLTALIAVRADGRRAALATGLLVLAMAPWIARGVVLSGYPLYPSALVSAPVAWRVPERQAVNEAESVRAWARVPGVPKELTLNGWYWLERWTERHVKLSLRPSFPLPLLLGATGLIAVVAAGSRGRSSRAKRGLLLLVPSAIGFGSWFVLGPDPRFAMFVFWSVAATGLATAVGVWDRAGARVVAAAAGALILVVVPKTIVPPGPEGGFHPSPRSETKLVETESGLRLYVPAKGDQCWDAPLPCTPFPHRNLRLRRPASLTSGFLRDS